MSALHPKKYLGCGFYLAAGVYMLATKPSDLITVIAIISCIALALLSATKHKDWAAIGGGVLIAGSIFLQSILSYLCLDCIRGDTMILAGVIALSIMERGKYRGTLIIFSSAIALLMIFTIKIHYSPLIVFSGRIVIEDQLSTCPEDGSNIYFNVIDSDGSKITLNSGLKPVLFYSPNCGACLRAIEALAMEDPEGRRWVPVQSYGDLEKGRSLLTQKKNGINT